MSGPAGSTSSKRESERAQLEPLGEDVDADEARGAHRPREHRGREADRAEAGDEDGVVAADPDPLEALVDRAEAAGDLRAVRVGERVGSRDEVLLLGEDEGRHAAVALPAVRPAPGAGAGDHVAAAAVVAQAAAGDVVDDDAVALREAAAAGAAPDDLPAGLVPRDHPRLVALRPLAEVLVVDAADVGAADRGALRPHQHLAVARRGHGIAFDLGGAVAGKDSALHGIGNCGHMYGG